MTEASDEIKRPSAPKEKRRARMPWLEGGAGQYALEIVSDILTVALIWLGCLAVLMSRGTIDLTPFKPRIEKSMSQAFGGETADVAHYRATWVQERQTIEIKADDIVVRSHGAVVETIDHARAEFAIFPKVFAKPDLSSLSIDGGVVTIERFDNGGVQIGLGEPGNYKPLGPRLQNITFGGGATGQRDWRAALGQFKAANVINAQVYIVDHLREGAWTFKNLSGGIALEDEQVNLQFTGTLAEKGTLADNVIADENTIDKSEVFMAFTTDTRFSELTGEMKLFHVNPRSVAPKKGRFDIMPRLDAPVDMSLIIDASRDAGLRKLALDMVVEQGTLRTGTTYKPFKSAKITAQYSPNLEVITVDGFSLESQALTTHGDAIIRNLGSAGSGFLKDAVQFELTLDNPVLNAGKKFDSLIKARSAVFAGAFDLPREDLNLETVKIDFGDFQTDLSLAVSRDGGALTAIRANGKILGTMTSAQLLAFWPNDFALGARDWIKNSIKAGEFSNFKLNANIDAQDLARRQIASDHLELTFDVKNADVKYMRQMPWLRGVNGYGILRGNQADVFVTAGRVDGLTVTKGAVSIPRFVPRGGDFTIELWGSGNVDEMLRVSNFPPFEFSKQFGIDPNAFTGTGDIALKVTRPLLEHFDQSRIRYEIEGDFANVDTPVGVGDFKLGSGQLKLIGGKDGLKISGPVMLWKWPAFMEWTKPFNAQGVTGYEGVPAYYTLKGKVTREHLDGFGVGLRRHFGGEIDLTLSGAGDGVKVSAVKVDADFTDADVNLGSLWQKPRGAAGTLSGSVSMESGHGYNAQNISIRAPGLQVDGAVALEPTFQLKSIDANRVVIKDFIDASAKGSPTKDGVLALSVSGQFLNVESWVDNAFQTQTSAVSAPILLTASLKELRLQSDYALKNAAFVFSNDGTAVQHARLKGTIDDKPFLAEISLDEVSNQRRVRTVIPDAAKAAHSFLGLNSIAEGALTIDGVLPPTGEQGGLNGQVVLEDFVLVRAPAFAQILSIASLSGLADTLSGSGLRFEILELQFALEDGVLKIRDGRATGPALGLTGSGDIGLAAKTVDFNGVLVPSYTVNSILGDVPLLGDIIVGKKGEGMFAINYAVKGPFAQTQVSVNPLSALTPGILRRIFDVKRDDVSDPVLQDMIEAQKQKEKQKERQKD